MSDILDDHESLSAETLAEASKAQLVDQNGKEYTLGELTKGKKVVLIFIRHYCELYSLSPGWMWLIHVVCQGAETVRPMSPNWGDPFRHPIYLLERRY